MTFLLSLLGVGGIAGAALYFAGPTAIFALLKTALAFLAKVPWYAFVILAAVLFGLYERSDARHWHKQADQNAAAYSIEVQKNAINLASIDALQTDIAAKNAESTARADAFTASKAQDARDVAGADARAKADAGRQARLQGIADHAAANPTCASPKAILDDLEGL